MSDIWTEICERLQNGQPLAVATIANEDGSTPRSAGSKMLVGAEGILAGTVGGGLGEAMTIDAGKNVLKSGESHIIPIDMSGHIKEGSDLVCGGLLDIFVERALPEHLDLYRNVRDRYLKGEDSMLVAAAKGVAKPTVIHPDGKIVGEALPAGVVKAILEDAPCTAGLMTVGETSYFVENVKGPVHLVLAGGGHVSRATAQVADLCGFRLTVIDDRPEFPTADRFPWVDPDRLAVAPKFIDCLLPEVIGGPVNENCFIAILTRGHAFDADVLAQSLKTGAGYIGMIGSRAKRKQVYEKMLGLGFTQQDLDRVHSPIGIKLPVETPEEIAVSIVAELIDVRAGLERGKR